MKHRCQKCGWEWIPRIEELPKVCPKCKSYNWNDNHQLKKENKEE